MMVGNEKKNKSPATLTEEELKQAATRATEWTVPGYERQLPTSIGELVNLDDIKRGLSSDENDIEKKPEAVGDTPVAKAEGSTNPESEGDLRKTKADYVAELAIIYAEYLNVDKSKNNCMKKVRQIQANWRKEIDKYGESTRSGKRNRNQERTAQNDALNLAKEVAGLSDAHVRNLDPKTRYAVRKLADDIYRGKVESLDNDKLLREWLKAKDDRAEERYTEQLKNAEGNSQLLNEWLKAKDARANERYAEQLENAEGDSQLLNEWLKAKDARAEERYVEQLNNKEGEDSEKNTIKVTKGPHVVTAEWNTGKGTGEDNPPVNNPPVPETNPSPTGMQYDPLVAIGIDRTESMERRAYYDARDKLARSLQFKEEDLKENGKVKLRARVKMGVKQMWKGRIFKGYYEEKYRKEYLEQYKQVESLDLHNADGSLMTPEQIVNRAKSDANFAMIMRMSQDNEQYIRDYAGEERYELNHDSQAYKDMSEAIKKFATKSDDDKWAISEAELREEIARISHELHGKYETSLNNYEAVALYVRGQVEHGEGLEQIMQGFKMYEAKSHEGGNAEIYRTKTEQIIDKLNHTGVTKAVPSEWVAGAVGIAGWAAGAATRNKLVQFASFGGSAALAGVLAAKRTSNEMKADYAAISNQMATGQYEDGMYAGKYGNELADLVPRQMSADKLMASIDKAREAGDLKQIESLINDITLREYISGAQGVNLIAWGKDEQVKQTEFLTAKINLQADFIRLKREKDPSFNFNKYCDEIRDNVESIASLNKPNKMTHGEEFDAILAQLPPEAKKIYHNIAKKNEAFNKLRRRKSFNKGMTTAATTIAFSAGIQEFTSVFDDNVRGVYEGLRGLNADAESTTVIENALEHFGLVTPEPIQTASTIFQDITGHEFTGDRIELDNLTEEQIAELREHGFNVNPRTEIVAGEPRTETISVNELAKNNAEFHRAGWMDNGTTAIDGNELALHMGNGEMYFEPTKNSAEILSAAQNGQFRLMVSMNDTQANPFEVIGRVDGGRIIFDPEPGSAAEQLINSGNGFKFAEVVGPDNMVHATEVGAGTLETITQQIPTTTTEIVGYEIMPTGGLLEQTAELVKSIGDGVVAPPPLIVYNGVGGLQYAVQEAVIATEPLSPEATHAYLDNYIKRVNRTSELTQKYNAYNLVDPGGTAADSKITINGIGRKLLDEYGTDAKRQEFYNRADIVSLPDDEKEIAYLGMLVKEAEKQHGKHWYLVEKEAVTGNKQRSYYVEDWDGPAIAGNGKDAKNKNANDSRQLRIGILKDAIKQDIVDYAGGWNVDFNRHIYNRDLDDKSKDIASYNFGSALNDLGLNGLYSYNTDRKVMIRDDNDNPTLTAAGGDVKGEFTPTADFSRFAEWLYDNDEYRAEVRELTKNNNLYREDGKANAEIRLERLKYYYDKYAAENKNNNTRRVVDAVIMNNTTQKAFTGADSYEVYNAKSSAINGLPIVDTHQVKGEFIDLNSVETGGATAVSERLNDIFSSLDESSRKYTFDSLLKLKVGNDEFMLKNLHNSYVIINGKVELTDEVKGILDEYIAMNKDTWEAKFSELKERKLASIKRDEELVKQLADFGFNVDQCATILALETMLKVARSDVKK